MIYRANKNLLAVALLCAFAFIFVHSPVVKQARRTVPAGVSFGESCGCACLLESRPWYGQTNPWRWLLFVAPPLIIFAVRPDAPKWQRGLRVPAVVVLGYVLMGQNVALGAEILRGPFFAERSPVRYLPACSHFHSSRYISPMGLVFGGIYLVVYAGWWEMIWRQYHKMKTGLIDKDFKGDWVSRIVVLISMVVTIFIVIVALMRFYE